MIRTLQIYLFLALYLLVLGMSVMSLLDVLRRSPEAYQRAGKRTKGFWLAVTGVATAVAFVAIPPPLGLGLLSTLAIVSAVAAIVYLVDVKPALGPLRRGGGAGRGPGTGGW